VRSNGREPTGGDAARRVYSRPLGLTAVMNTGVSSGPHLEIRVPGQPPWQVTLDWADYTLGRMPDNTIVLPANGVSRHHGRLERHEGAWLYTDLGSTNGTFVNDRPVAQVVLADGDVLRIDDPSGSSVRMTFHAPAAGGQQSGITDVPIGATELGSRPSLLIGRDPSADIMLDSPVVSRRHARLDRSAQDYVLTDLHSTNGTFVNGDRLERARPLSPGDVVQIGPYRLIYQADSLEQRASLGGMRLDGLRLTKEVGSRRAPRRILEDVSLSVYPREFVALVGTSGAGKSTLLRALNGSGRAEGHVLVNGDDLYRQFDLYRTAIGYVPQNNIIHQELTVESVLRYAARLRLPPDTSSQEIDQRIERVLAQVEIVGQRGQIVSSLSGGQRKRVSIAAELLAEPSLFFLDEPTSGLDPGLEKKMMLTLRRLADSGHTVVLVTHATANIRQCDHVCFLSQGRLVYFGPPEEALQFFGVTTGEFADIYAQLDHPDPATARERAAQLQQRFRQSDQYRRHVLERWPTRPLVQEARDQAGPARPPRVNSLRQFWVLTRRYLELVVRDRLLMTILLAIMPIIGMLVLLMSDPHALVGETEAEIARQLSDELAAGAQSASYAIVGATQRLTNAMAMAAVMLGLFAAAYEIVKERSIFRRERMINLRVLPYLASKAVVLVGFALVQCLLFLLTVALKVRLPADGVLLPAAVEMYVTLVLLCGTAIMTGLFISALVPRTNSVIYVVLVVLLAQFIFGGVQFELSGRRAWLSTLTMVRWANEALGTSVDIDRLDGLTRTRFQPDPVTREVSVDVPRPADDWVPVTVVTATRVITVPIVAGRSVTVTVPVPEVTVNELVTVTEAITRSFTVEPQPVDLVRTQETILDYSRTPSHLAGDWLRLLAIGLVCGLGTVLALRRGDGR
jgi:ABC-type multidrug transport system ATPase subunit/pSer/pThr/pTyr-binding forkhead associated (FHA) protein